MKTQENEIMKMFVDQLVLDLTASEKKYLIEELVRFLEGGRNIVDDSLSGPHWQRVADLLGKTVIGTKDEAVFWCDEAELVNNLFWSPKGVDGANFGVLPGAWVDASPRARIARPKPRL